LAIYHLAVSVISRARGHRIVASAAAQSATKLRDRYYGITHNHSQRAGVQFAEIRAPAAAPSWVYDRELLWNRVEAAERRKDSQLARVMEVSLPVELTLPQSIGLLREYVDGEFVSRGMIADVAVRRENPDNPNGYVLLTLREPHESGFGPKVRLWNRKTNLIDWRSAWAHRVNMHLARAGHRVRIDHRTLAAQQIELAPARKRGIGRPVQSDERLPEHLRDRLAGQRDIARQNGAAILEDPTVAIRMLARQRSIFTRGDLVRFLESRTEGAAQLEAVVSAVMNSGELVPAGLGDGEPLRFTSRDWIEAEKSLSRRAQAMAVRRGHAVSASSAAAHCMASWSPSQRGAFAYVVGEGDFKALALPSSEKSEFLGAAHAAFQAEGFRVLSAVPLQDGDPLTKNDVVVLEGCELIELKLLERLLAAVDRARAKIVLAADLQHLQAIGSISPLHSLLEARFERIPAPPSSVTCTTIVTPSSQ
jgi:hypothetical protein